MYGVKTLVSCKHCGALLEEDYITALDESHFCDEQCANDAGYFQCNECGEFTDSGIFMDEYDEYYCSEYCARDAGYLECERCGDWFYENDGIVTDDGTRYCCEHCAERDGYNQCCFCGDWFYYTDPYYNWDRVCESCADWHNLVWCDDMEQRVDESECEGCDERSCPYCPNRMPSCIHGYGHTYATTYYRLGIEYNLEPYIGIELEMCDGNWENAAEELASSSFRNHYELKEDGSISDGFELASMPATPSYHVQTDLWDEVTRTARNNGVLSHNGSSECSLHMHVSRDFFDDAPTAAAVIQTLFERFWSEFVRFSRRHGTGWCKLHPHEGDEPRKSWHLEECEKFFDKRNKGGDRYCALNLCRRETFEIRLWMGTLNVDTIKATVGMTYALAVAGKNMPLDWVDTVTWSDFIAFAIAVNQSTGAAPYLEAYLGKRGLS